MKTVQLAAALIFVLCPLASFGAPGTGAPGQANSASKTSEITVTLFGQPCYLSGPVSTSALKSIHSISPEQIYPSSDALPSSEPIRRSLERLKNVSELPSGFERYRERLTRRLQAFLAFSDGLSAAKSAAKSESLLKLARPFLQGKRIKEFETLAGKIDSSKKLDADLAGQLFEVFLDIVEPDPEETFHRTIQKLNIHYTCVFSEDGESDSE
ncbi:MAG TPA: hypothetical protein VJB59_06285 [Bdellovibrionota bacterium]|nr:hypothetical protein [Bdellovibrionota bacterium]